MILPILSVAIRTEHDTVAARQRSRQIARLLGFDSQDQTRIATAVSEIARNAFRYASGGRAEFILEGETPPQLLLIRISDEGTGIHDMQRILDGRYTSTTGMGLGIVGTRRLMDQFEIQTQPGRGTVVWMKKLLPRKAPFITAEGLGSLTHQLSLERPGSAYGELELQNQELLSTLDELRKRQEELKHVNRELEDTNRGVVALYAELDERADHLRRADTLKSKFLSNMSHEFRSPLNSILALSNLLTSQSDGPLTSEQQQQVGFIRRAADDLYELVNDLLDLAKVEAGKVEVKPVYFEVENLLGALRGMLRPLFLSTAVTLVFDSAEGLPPMYSDEGKISQILRNFISNALKFTEAGEVRVTASLAQDRILFAVADTGIGIAPEDQELIFQDFAQVDSHLQRAVKGTGLGLPLSKKLAQLLSGEINVLSDPGRGSTFTLAVPIEHAAATQVGSAPIAMADTTGAPVLVVENRPDTVFMYTRWLKGGEYRVVPVATTRDAEQAVAIERPVAIILDILLDGEDTWSLLASLKGAEDTRDIPVIVISTVEDPRKIFHLGADEYLVKPATQEKLLQTLRRLTKSVAPPTVLIIDDDEKDRYVLKHRLRGTRLTISEAATGSEGIAKAIEERPQLIFLDWSMPLMNGMEVLAALKSDPRTESIAIVLHTSKQLNPEEREEIGSQVSAILSKEHLSREDCIRTLALQLGEHGRILSDGV
ncbi:MAG: ATP-binding protein [Acidobacteriota bacterium]